MTKSLCDEFEKAPMVWNSSPDGDVWLMSVMFCPIDIRHLHILYLRILYVFEFVTTFMW